MHLYALPLIFALAGLMLYTVLGGADFGAGIWLLGAGAGERGQRLRHHTHHAMAPVWEANHVWLIFVLTVTWTSYPIFFGSVFSTLALPLFVAALGIIARGAAYALRSGTSTRREEAVVDAAFSISSILTPYMLGASLGAIASRRVPVGNAAGDLISSWLNPTSILIGVLAVAVSAYLAAVYLSADAARVGEEDLEQRFRARALGGGAIAGALAVGGLAVLHGDAHPLYHGLLQGAGIWGLVVSMVAGATTLGLVAVHRFEAARICAALAVAAILAGWALAQQPVLLPGLTVADAAAPHDTLVAVVVAVLAGGALLFPSLGLLFRLLLSGRFDPGRSSRPDADSARPPRRQLAGAMRAGLLGRAAAACLLAGVGLLTVADARWAHALGVVALIGFITIGFLAVDPLRLAGARDGA
jgi:cytochrome d ubiquinol oxidase subunit II